MAENSWGVGFPDQHLQKIAGMAGANITIRQISPKREAASKNTLPARFAEFAEMSEEAVQRAVAKNQHTLPETLERLSSSHNLKTRMAVADNPNTHLNIDAQIKLPSLRELAYLYFYTQTSYSDKH